MTEVPSRHVVRWRQMSGYCDPSIEQPKEKMTGSRQNKILLILSQRRSQSVQMSCMEATSNCIMSHSNVWWTQAVRALCVIKHSQRKKSAL